MISVNLTLESAKRLVALHYQDANRAERGIQAAQKRIESLGRLQTESTESAFNLESAIMAQAPAPMPESENPSHKATKRDSRLYLASIEDSMGAMVPHFVFADECAANAYCADQAEKRGGYCKTRVEAIKTR